ncbi:DnaD domain-containing protein [Salibacterium halotolerans]|uniref:DnaD and phage-associated domain-containing protein n=1 Tax=Salibacterium halotolerans TaxID=1884432 RepID=A0A1I5MLB0_9BACI|nr:DnaD domain protein [Salibacterium halotolerans]SFP09736.1 DnaD and phage-associated domain-containing protein [Salibacterium halotolerans]
MKRLKRVMIKEELVQLTGDYKLAITLNQMIYWSERIKDFEQFIQEENQRLHQDHQMQPINGWIYKRAEDLSDETMLDVSKKAMRDYLKKLVEQGWLQERRNPMYDWDRTKQYRVDLLKIQHDLHDIGYSLDGYRIDLSYLQNVTSNLPKGNPELPNETAIPEITTEITTENYNDNDDRARKSPAEFFEENGFGMISGFLADRFDYWHQQFQEADALLIKAMEAAVTQGKRNFRYVEAILSNWQQQNVQTVSDAEALEKQFQYKKGGRQRGGLHQRGKGNAGNGVDETGISETIRRRQKIAEGERANQTDDSSE